MGLAYRPETEDRPPRHSGEPPPVEHLSPPPTFAQPTSPNVIASLSSLLCLVSPCHQPLYNTTARSVPCPRRQSCFVSGQHLALPGSGITRLIVLKEDGHAVGLLQPAAGAGPTKRPLPLRRTAARVCRPWPATRNGPQQATRWRR